MPLNWKLEMESKSALEIAKYTLPMELFKVKVGGGHLTCQNCPKKSKWSTFLPLIAINMKMVLFKIIQPPV